MSRTRPTAFPTSSVMTSFSARPSIRRIDAEIAKLQGEIAALSAQRNALHPMNNLPEEIISDIFLIARIDLANSSNRTTSPAVAPWMTIVSVCRRWRQVTMNTPKLWSLIFPFEFTFAEEMIKRSGNHPLSIRLPGSLDPTPHHLSTVDSIMEHCERFEEVIFNIASFINPNNPPTLPTYVLTKLFSDLHRLPKLKTLHISVNGPLLQPYLPILRAHHSLPSLLSLTLRGIVIPLEEPLTAPQLAHLEIVCPISPQGPPAKWLLRLIQNYPLLSDLTVHDVRASHCKEETPKSISLPRLRFLKVSSRSAADAEPLFSVLDIPRTASLTLRLGNQVMEDIEASLTLIDRLLLHFINESQNLPPVHDIAANFFLSGLTKRQPDTTFNLVIGTKAECRQRLNFFLPLLPHCEDRVIRFFNRLSAHLPTVLTLTAAGSEQLSSLLATLYCEFSSVTSLVLVECTPGIFSTLCATTASASMSIPPHVLPKLEKITLTRCCLSEDEGGSSFFYLKLRNVIKEREECGYPLKGINLIQCNVTANQIEALGRLVPVWSDQ
ncbi:hypothetical protein ONZ45_g14443 [Pleurotus djamor]|nr:hypothetical protein ONZ45_g14443 [Pleurotus djamor]